MRKKQVTPGFYWVDRMHFGMTVGRVTETNDYEGIRRFVTFTGSSTVHEIGIPDASNATRIEPRRFKSKVVPHSRNRL